MKRTLTKIRLDDLHVRYKVTLEGDPSDPATIAGRVAQVDILRALVDQPQLLRCGLAMCDTLKLSHNGTSWQLDMESIETEA